MVHSRSTGPDDTGASYRLLKVGCILLSVCRQVLSFVAGQPFITLTGPSQRTAPGNLVPFNCTAGPFSNQDFNVTWMKDRDEHPASAQRPMTNDKGNYFITSKVWVKLVPQDVSSEITCEVTHGDLVKPLYKTMNLSQVLRGEWAVGRSRGHSFPWQHWLLPSFAQSLMEFFIAMADHTV